MCTYHILVVDDEAMIREGIYRWLTDCGHQVDMASDGNEAVELVGSVDLQYDIIIMDIEMPVLGGIDAIQLIRKTHLKLPIIAITGYTDYPHRIIKAGASQILPKPFRFIELESQIMRLLTKSK